MTKKIILALFLFISFFGGMSEGFAQGSNNSSDRSTSTTTSSEKSFDGVTALPDAPNTLTLPGSETYDQTKSYDGSEKTEAKVESESFDIPYQNKDDQNTAQTEMKETAAAKHKADCKKSGNCLDQATFEIKTDSIINIGFKATGANTTEKANFILGTIIQKLMIALGVLSVLIMTVGGGYIIMFHGQDELLSKGKSIFMSGVIALVVALSSYYIVSGLRFILYN